MGFVHCQRTQNTRARDLNTGLLWRQTFNQEAERTRTFEINFQTFTPALGISAICSIMCKFYISLVWILLRCYVTYVANHIQSLYIYHPSTWTSSSRIMFSCCLWNGIRSLMFCLVPFRTVSIQTFVFWINSQYFPCLYFLSSLFFTFIHSVQLQNSSSRSFHSSIILCIFHLVDGWLENSQDFLVICFVERHTSQL